MRFGFDNIKTYAGQIELGISTTTYAIITLPFSPPTIRKSCRISQQSRLPRKEVAMKIIIGCDEAAFEFKEAVKQYLETKKIEVMDVGVYDKNPVLYPDIAAQACRKIQRGEAEQGILICGTGIGMSITANKFKGIRAAVCHDAFSTDRARKSNNAQVMCLGARVIGIELAKMMIDIWLAAEFAGGTSALKVDRIGFYEQESN